MEIGKLNPLAIITNNNNTTIYFILFSLFIFALIKLVRTKPKVSPGQLPPSPPGLPVIGHIHHLVGRGLPHRALRSLSRQYGPRVLGLQIGEVTAVVISSPGPAREALRDQDPACADRPQSVCGSIVWYDYVDIAFSPYGEYWQQMRKICTMELLSMKNVRSLWPVRLDEADRLLRSIAPGEAVNLTDRVNSFTTSVICRAMFGKAERDEAALLATMQEALTLVQGLLLADFFPSFKWLQALSLKRRRLMRMRRRLDGILDGILEEHRSKGRRGEFGGEDIVDVFIRIQKNGGLQFPVTDDNIKAVIFDMFSGGSESSSAIVNWAMAELMRNPRAMAKAQSEIRSSLRGKKNIEESDLTGLTYLKLVIKETLRLHPPAPLLTRVCRDECKVDGYLIRPKTKVLVNVWSIGRDPEYWADPEIFEPERFANSSVDFLGNNFEFIPFGLGRRICPGINFGLANVELPLALLLYHFDWRMPNGMDPSDMDMSEKDGMTAPRKDDLFLVPIAYDHSTANSQHDQA
ncbi:Cytochrome P450 71B37 [Striga hermonthica]|uniref:Cytochrome P450 71B37 n=1 Tax=Striga hermonthica TaxID=68872 RepID=A0A9N7MBJ6_STRHE|nr:Cytochrome P450 71B37 [Striga hermonthica]